jgi:plastocyanin
MAVDGDGGALAAYYTGDGSIHQAAFDGNAWTTNAVADVGEAESERPETTGVAVDGEGEIYVTYYDPAIDAVALASGDGESFAPIETPGTMGGSMPAITVPEDGSQVFVAWYDHVNGNLVLGTLAEIGELALAVPSPTTSAAPAPAASPTGGQDGGPGGGPPCESTGTTAEIAAPPGAAAAGFDTQCLAVDANDAVEVTFDNQDPGVPHNWALFEDSGYTQSIEGAATPLTPGPATETADVPPLDEGTYYFRCDAHPATMTGQLYTG